MTDDELAASINDHLHRLVATIDIEGAPFHFLQTALLSTKRPESDGVERKIILWLEQVPLDDHWQPQQLLVAYPSIWRVVACQNCSWRGRLDQLGCQFEDIPDLKERIAPGEIVPAGECPQCGALAHLVDGVIP